MCICSPQLDLDASGIVEFSELSDTGGNMPSNEKIDEVSMKTAISYVTEKGVYPAPCAVF